MNNPQFDHEKLDVYQRSLEFIAWVTPLLASIKESAAPTRDVRDQLDRASLSILLNIAEGNGKRKPALRARFFDDARGSATECAACLDALISKGLSSQRDIAEGKQTLLRVVSMLTKLIEKNDAAARAEEDEADYLGNP
jgi:four helix bundle protein